MRNRRMLALITGLLLLFSMGVKAQFSDQSDMTRRYQSLLQHYLVPDLMLKRGDKRVCLLVKPAQKKPEFSLSLVETKDSMLFHVVAFKQSITDQLMLEFISGNPVEELQLDTVQIQGGIDRSLGCELFKKIETHFEKPVTFASQPVLDGTDFVLCIAQGESIAEWEFHQFDLNSRQSKIFDELTKLANTILSGLNCIEEFN